MSRVVGYDAPEWSMGDDVRLSDAADKSRSTGWWGMVWLCATEAMLFACFIASYFFLRGSVEAFGAEGGRYVPLTRPLIMTALLLGSSALAWWGERGISLGSPARLRLGLLGAAFLGVAFLVVQSFEYAGRDSSFTVSAYDSLFYTITGFHGAHVAIGVIILLVLQLRASLGHFDAVRHEAITNGVLYWHFVDGVWLAILASLYLSPRLF